MSMHINRFVDAIKAHESRAAKDFVMPMRDAKDLHADITKLLLLVNDLQSRLTAAAEVTQVELQGGSF
jgi:hypothetical protein